MRLEDVITVERRSHDYHAIIGGDRRYWGCGSTERDAIGNVVHTHFEHLAEVIGQGPEYVRNLQAALQSNACALRDVLSGIPVPNVPHCMAAARVYLEGTDYPFSDSDWGNQPDLAIRKGAGVILFHRPSAECLFFLRDENPDIRFPSRVDIIGGQLEQREAPEKGAIREWREEILDLDTGEPYKLGRLTLFRQYVDEWGTQQSIFGCSTPVKPDLQTNEGQGLEWLDREIAAQTEFAFDYRDVVLDFFDTVLL